jgi:GrpB-like predicted nucleotidyltransferase (UPF0157 family)
MTRRPGEPAGTPIVVVDYDPAWPGLFAALGHDLREALGDAAERIDHIGSTSVPGLAAKPVLDVQISVVSLHPMEPFADPLRQLGYVFRPDNPDRRKRYFREPPGRARTHIHVRRAGSFSAEFALLFRDYLRTHPADAGEYADLKRRIAGDAETRGDYTEAKGPFVWELIRRADDWAMGEGWEPGPSDC